METIYYILEKKEVKIGDIIDLNGINIEITQKVIDQNPDIFEIRTKDKFKIGDWVVWSGQNPAIAIIYSKSPVNTACYILNIFGDIKSHDSCHKSYLRLATNDEIKNAILDHYPSGCRIKSMVDGKICKLNGDIDLHFKDFIYIDGIKENKFNHKFLVYGNGKFAEIIRPLFITEDGIDIYEGENSYAVERETLYLLAYNKYLGNSKDTLLYFSTKEAAEKYIKDHSVKILEYYENILLNITGLFNSPIEKGITLDRSNFYYYLKSYEPKLYWTKVLQLIADDLNEGWEPNWNDVTELKYYIYIQHNDYTRYRIALYLNLWGQTVAFKSQELARKAIEIMGDKLDDIFKQ